MTILEALQRGGMLFLFVFLVLAVLYALVVVFSQVVKVINKAGKKAPVAVAAGAAPAPDPATVAVVTPDPTGEWGGTLRLQDVDEQTAAVIMAIVSDQSGIPLSELVFKSIRQVKPAE